MLLFSSYKHNELHCQFKNIFCFNFFKERLTHFEDIEELVERLEHRVKTEQSHVQWYFDENEKLKIQTAKMADTIRNLERSKFEFEQSVRELSDTNKDLNNDVKRLEQKLEIYTELFDKDSNFHSSLKRRSYQGDPCQEQADEKLIENALAPLMEEIKEKDAQIRNLQKAVEEKEVIVNSLNKEIDTLETNLAAMVTEKIRNMQVSNDAEKIRQQTTNNGNFSSHSGLFSNDSLQELKQTSRSSINNNYYNNNNNNFQVVDEARKIRIGEPCTLVLSSTDVNDVTQQQQQVSPTSPNKETYLALISKNVAAKNSLSDQVNQQVRMSCFFYSSSVGNYLSTRQFSLIHFSWSSQSGEIMVLEKWLVFQTTIMY